MTKQEKHPAYDINKTYTKGEDVSIPFKGRQLNVMFEIPHVVRKNANTLYTFCKESNTWYYTSQKVHESRINRGIDLSNYESRDAKKAKGI